jgi:hypothetical protein
MGPEPEPAPRDLDVTFSDLPVPRDLVTEVRGSGPLEVDPTGKSLSRWIASERAAGRLWAHASGRLPAPGEPRPSVRTVGLKRTEPPPGWGPPAPLGPDLEALMVERPWESLDWLRRWAAAGRDPAADVRRYAGAGPVEPGRQDPPIAVWIHAAVLGTWEPILRELFSVLDRSGLAAAAGSVNVGVVGPDADLSWFPPWAKVVRTDGPLHLGENSTLQTLWDWSRTAPPAKVCYLHTKGASHGHSPNVTAWRDYLVWANVLEWRRCASALDSHDAAGVDWVGPAGSGIRSVWRPPTERAGFVGNFWWATTAYLAALPAGRVCLTRDRWNAEFDFVGAGSPNVKTFHTAEHHHYSEPYHRSRYDPAAKTRSDCIKEARACPHRETNGSCQTARCKLGKGRDGVVYLSDCLDCLKGQP